MQFGLGLVVLLVRDDVFRGPLPVCLPAVAKELNVSLVLDVSLFHGAGCLEVQLEREPRGAAILVLGGALGVSPPASPFKAGLEVDKQGGVIGVDLSHILPRPPPS